jgi:hypothetical protein
MTHLATGKKNYSAVGAAKPTCGGPKRFASSDQRAINRIDPLGAIFKCLDAASTRRAESTFSFLEKPRWRGNFFSASATLWE